MIIINKNNNNDLGALNGNRIGRGLGWKDFSKYTFLYVLVLEPCDLYHLFKKFN